MPNVISITKAPVTFTVEVTRDNDSGMWVAVCDGLTLATEAKTYEALIERVWLIAPDMAMDNGLSIPETNLRLLFQHEAPHHSIAL